MFFTHQTNLAIGVDIGTTTIKVAIVEKISQGSFKLVDYAILELSLERETIESVWDVRTILGVGIARYAAIKATVVGPLRNGI